MMTSTIKDVSYYLIQGFRDSILGTVKVYKLDQNEVETSPKQSEPKTTLARRRAEKKGDKGQTAKPATDKVKVTHRIVQCCTWNGGIYLLSIVLFNYMVLPCLDSLTELIFGKEDSGVIWSWISALLSWTFGALWILPLFVISKIVNCFWFQDIADAAYIKTRGRPMHINISLLIADLLFTVFLEALFLIQGTLASFLPIPAVGWIVGLVHMSLLYSLYAFEYKWFNMGKEVHTRLTSIETTWPYYVGFGLPMAVLTTLHPSVIISGGIFALLFPLFIISANEADETSQVFSGPPLRLFAVVVAVTNAVFRHSITVKGRQPTMFKAQQSSPQKKAHFSQTHR